MTLIMPKKLISDNEYKALSDAANNHFESKSLMEIAIDESLKWEAHGQMYHDMKVMMEHLQPKVYTSLPMAQIITRDLGDGSFEHTFVPDNLYLKSSVASADSFITIEQKKTNCGKWDCPFCVEEFNPNLRNNRFTVAYTSNLSEHCLRREMCHEIYDDFRINQLDFLWNLIVKFQTCDFPMALANQEIIFL